MGKVFCEKCGDEFIPIKSWQKYCSKTHQIFVSCILCGEEFARSYKNRSACPKEHFRQCKNCGKDFSVNYKSRESVFCSKKCSGTLGQTGEASKKRKATNLEKFGCEFPLASQIVKDKISETNLERYGAENPFGSDEIKKKIEEINLERFGFKNAAQNKEVRKRTAETNLKKYGTEAPIQNEEIFAKVKKTNLERYGAETPLQSEVVQEKIKQTVFERYGVDHIRKDPKINEKAKSTYLERYGNITPASKNIEHIEEWKDISNWAINFKLSNGRKPTYQDAVFYFKVNYNRFCAKTGELNIRHLFDKQISKGEFYFQKFLEESGLIEGEDFLVNDRQMIKPQEIDFYFPKTKLGVEISPTFTHNSTVSFHSGKEPTAFDYHVKKALACEAAGVELITVFDWMPLEKVKEMVVHKLKGTERRIFARKCEVSYIAKGSEPTLEKTLKNFLNDNHVLGFRPFSIEAYTLLKFEEELIGVMVFGKRKLGSSKKLEKDSDNSVELQRMVFKPGLSIPGGASRLLKTFLRNNPRVKEVVTFSDYDLGAGNVYGSLGFDLISSPKPGQNFVHPLLLKDNGDIWRVKNTSLQMAGADRLLKSFPNYVPVGMVCLCELNPDGSVQHSKAECLPTNREILELYGFQDVWDCGYKKWSLKP